MKLVLHIGTEKTGTSSIQSFFNLNKKQLLGYGVYYLSSPNTVWFRELAAYVLREGTEDDFFQNYNISNVEDERQFRHEFESRVRSELESLPDHIHTVVASSEHLHSRVHFLDEVKSIKTLFRNCFDVFQVITYFRPQVDVAVSRYSTALKSKMLPSADINNYLERTFIDNEKWYDYFSSLSNWNDVFGSDAMTVRLFDRKEFHNGDLIDDFMFVIGGEELSSIREELPPSPMDNESINFLGQAILLSLNSHIMRTNKNQFLIDMSTKIIKVVSNVCRGKGRTPRSSTAKELACQFVESNERLRERYFPNRNNILEHDFSKYNSDESDVSVSSVLNEKFDKCFSDIVKKSDNNIDVATDIIRDAAISMEETDVDSAFVFMSIAKSLRPNGPTINNKMQKYKVELKDLAKSRV